MVGPQAIRKLVRELATLRTNPPDDDIRVRVDEEDILAFQGIIAGPEGTPYYGGYFHVRFTFSDDFPGSPPKCHFTTKIFHPNVGPSGDICVNTLKRDWQPTYGIGHILTVIKCLLIEPNPDSALDEEAGRLLQEEFEAFFKRAKLMTSIHATRNGRPAEFAEEDTGSGSSDDAPSGSKSSDPTSMSLLSPTSLGGLGLSISTSTPTSTIARPSKSPNLPTISLPPANTTSTPTLPPLQTSAQSNAPRSPALGGDKDLKKAKEGNTTYGATGVLTGNLKAVKRTAAAAGVGNTNEKRKKGLKRL